jgi:hypothetical protein
MCTYIHIAFHSWKSGKLRKKRETKYNETRICACSASLHEAMLSFPNKEEEEEEAKV